MARAWRGHGTGVARAWRGRGAGKSRDPRVHGPRPAPRPRHRSQKKAPARATPVPCPRQRPVPPTAGGVGNRVAADGAAEGGETAGCDDGDDVAL
eukprot:gene21279-biopygen1098